jgi:dihydroorotate dehydrogenase
VATNTTTERPSSLASSNRAEEGGLSGEPIEARATEMVRYVARRVDAPVIGVGGVSTAADAYRKLRAGARLVQLYTAFVYRGPAIAREINRGLLDLLERDGFDSVEAAIGVDA